MIAGQVDPEIADRLRRAASEAAHQRDRDGDTGGAGEKGLDRDPRHLRRVAERRLAAVGLPTRVRGEADRGVQCQVRRDGIERCGLSGSRFCTAAAHRARRCRRGETRAPPAHSRPSSAPRCRIDAGQPVNAVFQGGERALELAVRPPSINAGDVAAQRPRDRRDQCCKYERSETSLARSRRFVHGRLLHDQTLAKSDVPDGGDEPQDKQQQQRNVDHRRQPQCNPTILQATLSLRCAMGRYLIGIPYRSQGVIVYRPARRDSIVAISISRMMLRWIGIG